MATTTGFGYPMMDTIRSVIAQIDRALLPYATKRTFSVKTLPPNLLLYCQERSSSATLMALRRYRVTLQDQLLELVIASRDQAVLASHLQWARKTMSEIETFYFSYHYESPNPAAPPMDLVSCIYDNFTDTAVSLQKRYVSLKEQEYKLCLADMQMQSQFAIKHAGVVDGTVDQTNGGVRSIGMELESSCSVDGHVDLPPYESKKSIC